MNQPILSRAVFLALAVAGCSSSNSQSSYDDLRNAAAARQSGYPAPPVAEDPHSWSTLLPDAGATINDGKNGPAPGAGGDVSAGGSFGAGGLGVAGFGAGGFAGSGGFGFAGFGGVPVNTEGGPASPTDEALASTTTFSPGASGVAPSGNIDSSASVTGVSPSPLIFRPGLPTGLDISYSASGYNVDGFSFQFGNATPIRIPDLSASGVFSGTAPVTATPSSFICDTLAAGCYPGTVNIAPITTQGGLEFPGLGYSVASVLECGDCSSPGCSALDPKCATTGTSTLCGAFESTSASVTELVNMQVSSGSSSLTISLQTGSARFQVADQGSSVYDTGCLTTTGPGLGYNFTYSGFSTQLTLTVTTNCNGSGPGSVFYEVACPVSGAVPAR